MTHQVGVRGRPRGLGRPAFVATTGGHLVEMRLLANVVEPGRHQRGLWITHRTPQSESLLAGEEVHYVDMVGTRDVRTALRITPKILRTLRQNRVDAVYSTGAIIAVSALPLGPLLGSRATYIESLTRPSGPSLSGRILSFVPWVEVRTQYPALAGRRWKYVSSLMDSFAALPKAAAAPPPRRVFVTVGTAGRYQFRRLLERLIQVIPPECTVVWQTGSTRTQGLPIQGRPMMSDGAFQEEIRRADVVVAHAGCGTFLRCLQLGKTPVLVPRRAAHDEHVDDHQEQLAHVAQQQGLAIMREADQVTWADICGAATMQVHLKKECP